MSENDFEQARLPGYYDSVSPCECGGPRRQKASRVAGIGLKSGESLKATSRDTGEWNVMIVGREPGELYVQGNNLLGAEESYGFVEKIDPLTLQPLARTPNLDAGGHTWCGGVAVHENGDLYLNNGDRCYRLSADCEVLAHTKLPMQSAYNGFLIMADGALLMKNMEHDPACPSVFSLLDPHTLKPLCDPIQLPEASMGRIAMDTTADGQFVYVPGHTTLYRYRYAEGALTLDEDWSAQYRQLADPMSAFAWDSCISGGHCWFMDNGDNRGIQTIFATRPVGQQLPRRGAAWQGTAGGPVQLHRVSLKDSYDIDRFTPFDLPQGSIISPPAFDPARNIALAFDTGNAVLGAFRYQGPGKFERLWRKPLRISMQMCLFTDTGEIAVNDFHQGRDNIVLLDIESGEELGRVATESRTANGMLLSAGGNRDIYYCSTVHIARVYI